MSAIPAARRWPGLIPMLRRAVTGDRSDQERAERVYTAQRAAEERQLLTRLREEAERYADAIRATLTRKGVCYRYTRTERQEVIERVMEVQFIRPFYVSAEVIKIRIDTRRLPRGIGLAELENEEILRLLSYNCKHRVSVHGSHDTGYWYWIEREFGIGGIPTHLAFDDAMGSRPATLAGERLAFPVGSAENKRFIWRTVPQSVNLLVAGSPDRGKSNFVNSVICTLLKHNDPRHLQLMLVDLKGGLEFNFYSGLSEYLLSIPKPKKIKAPAAPAPAAQSESGDESDDPLLFDASENVNEPDPDEPDVVLDTSSKERVRAFIERREEVPAALSWLIAEAERRMAVIREANCKKISEYNQRHSFNPLPYILLVVDEWADIKLTPRVGARAEERLINITNRARAVGIHTIVCTQSPNRDVLSIRVKNAMNSRMVFGCADQYMSQGLLGDYSATKLETRGRGVFVSGRDRMEVQCPYIPNELVERVVAEVQGGAVVQVKRTAKHDVSDMEIFEWALRENNGHLGQKAIYEAFGPRKFPKNEADSFARQRIGRRIEIDGRVYTIVPGRRLPNPIPARLLPIEEAEISPGQITGDSQLPDHPLPAPWWPTGQAHAEPSEPAVSRSATP